MWMNSYEIDETLQRLAGRHVLGTAARFLAAFRDEVNENSDGWAYWQRPAKAAEKLMKLLQQSTASEAEFKKALTPIKAFMTRYGYKAGMQMPEIDGRKAIKTIKSGPFKGLCAACLNPPTSCVCGFVAAFCKPALNAPDPAPSGEIQHSPGTPKTESAKTVAIPEGIWKSAKLAIESLAIMGTLSADHPDGHAQIVQLARAIEAAGL